MALSNKAKVSHHKWQKELDTAMLVTSSTPVTVFMKGLIWHQNEGFFLFRLIGADILLYEKTHITQTPCYTEVTHRDISSRPCYSV